MPTLLDLPSELIFEILDLVTSSIYPPSTADTRHRPQQLRSRSVICYPEAQISWPTGLNLLLTNRKLYSEVSLYFNKKPPSFQLDLAIVNANWIWPTWRCIPPRSCDHVRERLTVNVIPCCTDDERGQQFQGNIRSEETMVEVLKIVSHFLLQGPFDMASDHHMHRPKRTYSKDEQALHFKSLVFDLDTARHRNGGSQPFSDTEIPFRRINGLAHLDFDPLHPADAKSCVQQLELLALVFKNALHRVNYGLVICERVVEIVFTADGRDVEKIDILRDVKNKQKRDVEAYKQRIGLSQSPN